MENKHMKNIKYMSIICILLIFVCGSFGCIQNTELEESFNELNNTVNVQEDIINNLESKVNDSNEFLIKYSKAKAHTFYGIDSDNMGDRYWDDAFEDDYYVDPYYLEYAIEEYEYSVYYFEYSNNLLSEISTIIPDNNFIKTDIENLKKFNNIGKKYDEGKGEYARHYERSSEYIDDKELSKRYYNLYLDTVDETDSFVDEYNSLYKILFEHNDIDITW